MIPFRLRALSLPVVATCCILLLAKDPASASPLPPNDLHLEDRVTRPDSNIDEATFNALIDRALAHYQPLAKKHRAALDAQRLWNNNLVNAFATRTGPIWGIAMYGGLARRPEVTADGFQLVICHEIGHLFAGYPYKRNMFGSLAWASVEGESDYFATQSCARALWKDDTDQNLLHIATVDPEAARRCDAAWESDSERALCYRIADAGMSLARLLASAAKDKIPSFESPDPTQITKTDKKHPAAQCRLDTYLEGALCSRTRDPDMIPGKRYTAHWGMLFNRRAEAEAAGQSCYVAQGYLEGMRPRCWFAPRR